MGHMKELDIRIRQGGDDAIAAACELLPRWISVEERLPPHLELVLVNHCRTGIEMAARQPDGQWVIFEIGYKHSGVAYTHWMTLPSPPEVTT